MNNSWLKLILLGLVLALLLGCATTGAKTTDSTKTDTTRTKVEGAAVGTAVGAGVGAAIGAIAGGKDGAKIGAAIGGIVGLAGGALFGKSVAERKQEYLDAEERLNNEIKIAVNSNAQLRDYNAQTETQIAALDKEISRLKLHYEARAASLSQLEQQENEIRGSISDAEQLKSSKEKELSALNEYLASVATTQQQSKTAQLQKEVDELKANIAMLDSNTTQMAKMADSLTVRK